MYHHLITWKPYLDAHLSRTDQLRRWRVVSDLIDEARRTLVSFGTHDVHNVRTLEITEIQRCVQDDGHISLLFLVQPAFPHI